MTSTNVVVAELFDPVAGKRAVKVGERGVTLARILRLASVGVAGWGWGLGREGKGGGGEEKLEKASRTRFASHRNRDSFFLEEPTGNQGGLSPF